MKNQRKLITAISLIIVINGFLVDLLSQESNIVLNYVLFSRLTDPQDDKYLIDELPNDIDSICDIANVQLVHYRILSQMKIPKNKWNTRFANYSLKDILDTLKSTGNGKLTLDRNLRNRIISACTKESIFSTGILRSKGIQARMRVGFLINLYTSPNSLQFWKNVKEYEQLDTTGEYPDEFTLNAVKVNRAIEHWVTEYFDESTDKWKLLDIRPEYINAYGKNVNYGITEGQDFEFGWQVWKRINDTNFTETAYNEGDLDAKTHVRYQMMMDFYSLLNYDIPGVFDSNGKFIGNNGNDDITFMKKKYSELTPEEIYELDKLAELLSKDPSVKELIDFYLSSNTLRLKSVENDKYSFVYKYLNTH